MKRMFLLSLLFVVVNLTQAQSTTTRSECVLDNGKLKEVQYQYNATTGAKSITVNGQVKSFDEVYPLQGKGYAAELGWFINNEFITIKGVRYAKYGLPRVLGLTEVVNYSTYKEGHVFAEPGITGQPEVVYVMVRRGCEFQPYVVQIPPCDVKIKLATPLKSVTAGKEIVVTATASGTKYKEFTYSWSVFRVTDEDFDYVDKFIVGPKNGKSIKLATKEAKGSTLTIEVVIKPKGIDCEASSQTIHIEVK